MDRQSTSYKKKIYTVAALVVLIIVSISGCTDKPKEVQDEVNVYIYEEMDQEGDSEEQIHEFYDWASQAGPPDLKPVAQYAAEFDIDPRTGNLVNVTIYDHDGTPFDSETARSMQDRVVIGDDNLPVTDAALLDLHIKPIGKNKYEILNIAQELQVEDGVWTIGYDMWNEYSGKTKFNDNIFKIGDHDDMYGGCVRGEDGKDYGVILFDIDTCKLYGTPIDFRGGMSIPPDTLYDDCFYIRGKTVGGADSWGNYGRSVQYLGNGIFMYLHDLSEIDENPWSGTQAASVNVRGDPDIAKENQGFAQFRFLKQKL